MINVITKINLNFLLKISQSRLLLFTTYVHGMIKPLITSRPDRKKNNKEYKIQDENDREYKI